MMSSAELKSGHNFRNAKRDDLSSCKNSELHECEKGSFHELASILESDKLKLLSSESVDILKLCGENQLIEEFYSQPYSVADAAANLEQQLKEYNPSAYSYNDGQLLMLQNVAGDGSQKPPLKADSSGYKDLDYYSHLDPEYNKKTCSELDSEWMGVEKAGPWWRTADKELAALGTPKSSWHIESSDPPWNQCLVDESYSFSECSSQVSTTEKEFLVAPECNSGQHPSQSLHKRSCVAQGSTDGLRQLVRGNEDLSSAKVLSVNTQSGSSNLSKGQLLEALCHSQTRAREAEQLAQQAFNEKEHVIKLFFRQASHLFAYRQWLQILQLEALCLQLRNKGEESSHNLSPFLPIIPSKGRKLKKFRYNKPIKRKQGKGKCKINKAVVAFALGLSLAGAGLLLGWTMGWLFPAF